MGPRDQVHLAAGAIGNMVTFTTVYVGDRNSYGLVPSGSTTNKGIAHSTPFTTPGRL